MQDVIVLKVDTLIMFRGGHISSLADRKVIGVEYNLDRGVF